MTIVSFGLLGVVAETGASGVMTVGGGVLGNKLLEGVSLATGAAGVGTGVMIVEGI